ncbi:sigma-70 family RNA polymerase sigma factor [Flavobacterium galactosidilyticum]|uniref:RNA polymerase sigma factor n=1 Tax=Flavobacterium galactosidilyticum TaxID=2893886 RepID=UPI001E2945D2|nr:sigma-70 family RNA polymerase sigma factor [Flavobacterium sp. F-340]UFH46399.1 sigma-70 family RNA polymerase sigma factor [Flavobacterium sp. F-340]
MKSISKYTDKELLDLLSNDSSKAFEEIYHRYWQSMIDAAFRRIKDIDNSKDIVQNVFIDLWNRRNKVEIENLAAYLNTAVRFQVFKIFSKKKSSPVFLELFDTILSQHNCPESDLHDQDLKILFDSWINCLPEKRRKIFLLHFRENRSTKEIAELLQISQKTVQNQVGRATTDLYDKVILSTLVLVALNEIIK